MLKKLKFPQHSSDIRRFNATTCVFNNTATLHPPFCPPHWKCQYRVHMTSYSCMAQGQIRFNINSSHTATDTISVIVYLMLCSWKAKMEEKKLKGRQTVCTTRSSEMVWFCQSFSIIRWTDGCATLIVVQKQWKALRLWGSGGPIFNRQSPTYTNSTLYCKKKRTKSMCRFPLYTHQNMLWTQGLCEVENNQEGVMSNLYLGW